jgi:PAS domain S-box-containing protein
MANHKPPSKKTTAELRRQAEQALRERAAQPSGNPAVSVDETSRLLHELQVHQLELEMQNEELRETQAELEASRARYFEMYDLAPVGYLVLDREGLILESNLTAARLLGVDRSALAERPFVRFVFRDDKPIYYASQKKLYETGVPATCELRLSKKDGVLFWAALQAVVAQNDDGAPLCRVAMTDLTARKEAEALRLKTAELEKERLAAETAQRHLESVLNSLRASEERLRRLGRAGRIGLYEWNVDANRAYSSPEAFELFGYQPSAEANYERWLAAIHPDDRARAMGDLTRLLAETRAGRALVSSRQEYRFVHADGAVLWLETTTTTELADGQVVIRGAVRDVTERKRAEDALRDLNATLEQRVRARTAELERRATQLRAMAAELALAEERERKRMAGILHDGLQQILVAAKFGASTLRQQVAGGEHEAPAQRVIDLLGQCIDASRSLTMELSPPILSDAGLAAGLSWLARWMREKHGLAVELTAPEQIAPMPDDLRLVFFQAVRELLFNVVKHAGVNAARVNMTYDNGQSVTVVVADDGHGFDAAVQAAASPAGALGLFSIRERFAFLGGRVEIASSPGHGTRVTLHAPIASAAQTAPSESTAAATADPAAPPAVPGAIRVLVADDHTVVRQGLVELLRKEPGLVVMGEAADGKEAVDRARQLRPDVVLMDVGMPVMDGIAATGILSAELPQTRVIALSLHAADVMAAQMRAAGAVAYFVKDGPLEELVAAIREAARRP